MEPAEAEGSSDSRLTSSLILLATGGVVSGVSTREWSKSVVGNKNSSSSSLASPLVLVLVVVVEALPLVYLPTPLARKAKIESVNLTVASFRARLVGGTIDFTQHATSR